MVGQLISHAGSWAREHTGSSSSLPGRTAVDPPGSSAAVRSRRRGARAGEGRARAAGPWSECRSALQTRQRATGRRTGAPRGRAGSKRRAGCASSDRKAPEDVHIRHALERVAVWPQGGVPTRRPVEIEVVQLEIGHAAQICTARQCGGGGKVCTIPKKGGGGEIAPATTRRNHSCITGCSLVARCWHAHC